MWYDAVVHVNNCLRLLELDLRSAEQSCPLGAQVNAVRLARVTEAEMAQSLEGWTGVHTTVVQYSAAQYSVTRKEEKRRIDKKTVRNINSEETRTGKSNLRVRETCSIRVAVRSRSWANLICYFEERAISLQRHDTTEIKATIVQFNAELRTVHEDTPMHNAHEVEAEDEDEDSAVHVTVEYRSTEDDTREQQK